VHFVADLTGPGEIALVLCLDCVDSRLKLKRLALNLAFALRFYDRRF
jgi:hypothetical protein